MGRKKRKKRARAASAPAKAPKKAPPRQKRKRKAAPDLASPDASRKRNFWIVVGILGLLLVLGYAKALSNRIIGHDEGYYLAAYHLAKNGQLPYIDFFYPQFPGVVYISALWSFVAGSSPLALRILSLLFTVGTFCLLAWWCWQKKLSTVATAAILVLWGINDLSIVWLVTIQSYALMVFLSVASFVCLSRGIGRTSHRMMFLFLGGLLLGLAAASRLFYVFCWPVALFWVLFVVFKEAPRWREVARAGGWFSAGFAVGMLPVLCFMLLDFERFWFNCITAHALRNPTDSFAADWSQKIHLVNFLRSQAALLLTAILAAPWILWWKEAREKYADFWLAFGWAGTVGAASFLPTPAWKQYFVIVVPFLVIPAVLALKVLFSSHRRRLIALGCICTLGIAIGYGTAREPWGRITLYFDPSSHPRFFSLQGWLEAGRIIESLTEPDDLVFSLWPGFPVAANRKPVPRMENTALNFFSNKIDSSQREKLHVADEDYVRDVLLSGAAKVVVDEERIFPGAILWGELQKPYPGPLGPLLAERYRVAATVEGAVIYVLQ